MSENEFPTPTPPPGDLCDAHVFLRGIVAVPKAPDMITDKERPIIGVPGPGCSRPAVLPDPDAKKK